VQPCKEFLEEAESWLKIKLPTLHPDTWTKDILCDPIILDSDRSAIVTIMWSICMSRNNIVHDKGSLDPVQSLKMTRCSGSHRVT
jgi:hypothetical protein